MLFLPIIPVKRVVIILRLCQVGVLEAMLLCFHHDYNTKNKSGKGKS